MRCKLDKKKVPLVLNSAMLLLSVLNVVKESSRLESRINQAIMWFSVVLVPSR